MWWHSMLPVYVIQKGNVTLVSITGCTILVPRFSVKSQQLIWRLGTHRFHLWVPNLQMNCRDLIIWQGTRISGLNDGRSMICLIGSPFCFNINSWWRHQMETFSALLAICAGNSPVTDEFLAQRPVTWRFEVFFDLCLNKWLNKQSWGWWF